MTMLGIIIGVFSAVFIQCIGDTIAMSLIQTEVSDRSNIMVSNTVVSNNLKREKEELPPIPEVILEKYQKLFNGELKRIVEKEYGIAELVNNDKINSKVEIIGASSELFELAQLDIINGRGFDKRDENYQASVIVVSENTAKDCFKNENPIGQKLMLYLGNGKVYDVIVIGVFKSLPPNTEENELESVYIPAVYMNAKCQQEEKGEIFVRWLLGTDVNQELFLEQSEKFFKKYYENSSWKVKTEINTDESYINTIMSIFSKVVSAIAMISFLVGGINIMNMLLISVGERTKEIGILKAIGVGHRYIVLQFICETIALSVTGCLIGMVAAVTGSIIVIKIMSIMMKQAFMMKYISLPFETMLMYLGGAIFIGVVFGVYPAYRAAKKNIVEALKSD